MKIHVLIIYIKTPWELGLPRFLEHKGPGNGPPTVHSEASPWVLLIPELGQEVTAWPWPSHQEALGLPPFAHLPNG